MTIDTDAAWAAFEGRDRSADGRFVVGVRTTGIYCKPSCPARHPRRENVTFFADAVAARAHGLRACLRCRPDELGRDRVAVASAIAAIEASTAAIPLTTLAAGAGYAPHHFHRLFTRETGVTPAAFARGRRVARVADALTGEKQVTRAIYDAGYAAPSRFYADAGSRLGMRPSAWAKGGAGETIRWTIAATTLGDLLIAATDKGLCRVSFDEDERALAARFPAAAIESGGEALAALAAEVIAVVESPGRGHALPMDVRGTAFQEAVWQALASIPPGETRTYSELAALAGNPAAVRAAGSACGANPLALVVPCHRAQRSDGTLGGYAYGLERKRVLLARERGG
ncbi:methylated-DNA--[protein]-cysteine S-methyltransferase [Sphingomonas sp.]|jgi:AraC family transcriptional regulator of adaptative response/methylated-DNA-[protein]-cysteine methyltransferase|uniref:bifunctional transcriptional activator/DNA repair enzyme AdaA n=1 Tax=Sphingomonas sp. TaxID=28214 RepID=UPI002EDA3E53